MYKQFKKDFRAFLFLLPFMIFYLAFTIFPMFKGIYISLHDWSLLRKLDFVGLDNYIEMIMDPYFWQSLWNTTYFVIISTPLMVIMALTLAIIANQKTPLKRLYRISFFIPSILAVSVVSNIIINMAQPYMGFINMALHTLNILPSGQEIFWFKDQNLAWMSITGLTIWWTVGFNMMLYLSAMQDIPNSVYEAAEIDGATKMKTFFHITLPLLKPISGIIVLLQVIASYKLFAQVWLTTKGGPGTVTRPIIQYIYESGFVESRLGYASAMSYALFVILLALSILQFKLRKKEA